MQEQPAPKPAPEASSVQGGAITERELNHATLKDSYAGYQS